MIPHDKLTIIRNRHRAKDLRRFRNMVEIYFERAEYDEDDLLMDWDGAREARAQINRMLPRIIQIVRAAGLVGSNPRPASGGSAIAVLEDIFKARYADGACQEILDIVDMAVGVYEASFFNSLARTINPLHYIGLTLGFVIGLPGQLFRSLGWLSKPRHSPGNADDPKQVEDTATRLGSIERLIESRFAEMRDWQQRQFGDSNGQITDLAERLDFAERVLAQQRPINRIGSPVEDGVATPV